MLTVDSRAGSKELYKPLVNLGVPALLGNLAAGDIEFLGNGPEGPTVVLVEYKKLGDLFQCIRDGRFADQLRGMKASAEFNWLLIEGRLRGISRGSRLQAQRRSGRWRAVDAGMTYQEMVGWVLTMCAVAGVMVWRTETQEESVEWIRGLYNWWTAKEWEKHRAHMEFYTPPPSGGNPFVPPPLVQKVATVLPRIGSTKAARVAREFKSVIDLINATEVELQRVKGIGPKDAKTIREAVRNG